MLVIKRFGVLKKYLKKNNNKNIPNEFGVLKRHY